MEQRKLRASSDAERKKVSRRTIVMGLAGLLPAPLIAACDDPAAGGRSSRFFPSARGGAVDAPPSSGLSAHSLRPTPSCDDEDDATPPQTEGPFFTPNSPERTSLVEPDVRGRRFVLSGLVLTTDCRPVAGALLDFWQADDDGAYDNRGHRLRGHQFTDGEGRYFLETIVPGLYPGRTRHFHVKVQAPNQPVLTTQLYFPDEPQNRRDRIFHPALLMNVGARRDAGTFDVVLKLG